MNDTIGCAHCGRPFTPTLPEHRYCVASCRRQAQRERQSRRPAERARGRFLSEQARITAAWKDANGIPRQRGPLRPNRPDSTPDERRVPQLLRFD
jgi:hypothetical protein